MQKFVQPFFARMRASAREVRRISSMTGAAMLAALAVVLDRFTWQVGPMLEIGVSFLAVGVSGFLYGPWPVSYTHLSVKGRPSAAPAGDTCLNEAAAGRLAASFSSFTSCHEFSASRKLI